MYTALKKLLQDNAKMCLGLMFCRHECFVDFHLHDLENKLFSLRSFGISFLDNLVLSAFADILEMV